MNRLVCTSSLLFLLLTTACGARFLPFPVATTAPSTQPVVSTETPLSRPLETGTPAPPVASATPSPLVLRVWLPPQFDPNGTTTAAQVLRKRLDDFATAHPDISLDIRIKGSKEPSDLLEALSLTRSAAPAALPELVALPRAELEAAALKGILHPLEGLSDQLEDPNWYPYARQSGHVQNASYGLPFAGDALAIVYHPSAFSTPPSTWEELFARQRSLAFVETDPDSLLVLNLYLSTGSKLLDVSNRPYLDPAALTRVLQLLQGGRLVPLQSEDAAWRAFTEERADVALVWSSRFILEPTPDAALMPLPSLDGQPFTPATTWSWALAGSDPQTDEAAASLAKWLVSDEFLVEWDQAAGYLSPRPNALKVWDKDGSLDQLSQSADVMPGNDILAAMGPVLRDSLAAILKGENPQDVALAASQALK